MKAVVAAFNQEKALVGAFSVITNLRMELFEALVSMYPVRNRTIVVIVKVRGSAYRHTAASCLRVLRTTRRYLLVISGQG